MLNSNLILPYTIGDLYTELVHFTVHNTAYCARMHAASRSLRIVGRAAGRWKALAISFATVHLSRKAVDRGSAEAGESAQVKNQRRNLHARGSWLIYMCFSDGRERAQIRVSNKLGHDIQRFDAHCRPAQEALRRL